MTDISTDAGLIVSGSCSAPPNRGAEPRIALWRRIVPNIGWQLVLERCIHGVAEQFHRWKWSKGNRALYDQPCSLSTMTSRLSILWPSMVPSQRRKVVRSSSLYSAV